MPNKDNCLRCKIATPSRGPEITWTSGAGDLVESLRRVWTVLLNCWSNDDISLAVRTRLASPDIKTGVPYIESILRDAAGFDLCLLARPQEVIAPKAFLNAENL